MRIDCVEEWDTSYVCDVGAGDNMEKLRNVLAWEVGVTRTDGYAYQSESNVLRGSSCPTFAIVSRSC